MPNHFTVIVIIQMKEVLYVDQVSVLKETVDFSQ